ncbi:VOC family protein [Pseudoalteromonas xiamenensis]
MVKPNKIKFPNMILSHIELYVQDVATMESFYTNKLGFVVTDRGNGKNGLVFLSRSPDEHHQIVLNPVDSANNMTSPVDYISFKVSNIKQLRSFYISLKSVSEIKLQTVSHGSTWSVYFRDPENNRFEIFTDTPWYVNQPCKFEVDFDLSDEKLIDFTHSKIKSMSGYTNASNWQESHNTLLTSISE